MSRSIDQQRLAVPLEHLLLQNGESGKVATQTGAGWGIARENSNLRACGQLFVYFPDGRVKIRITGESQIPFVCVVVFQTC